MLLKGVDLNYDSIQKSKSLEYLQTAIGEDTPCMGRMGGNYSSADMEQPGICLGDYIQYVKLFQERYKNENKAASKGIQP